MKNYNLLLFQLGLKVKWSESDVKIGFRGRFKGSDKFHFDS